MESISQTKVVSAYENWKGIFEIKKKGHDMMLFLINRSSQGELQQLFIDTWYSIEKSVGKEELYKRFISRYGYMDKTKYMNNIYCLEILSWFNQIIKNNS